MLDGKQYTPLVKMTQQQFEERFDGISKYPVVMDRILVLQAFRETANPDCTFLKFVVEKRNMDVNRCYVSDSSLLHSASKESNLNGVQYLISKGAKIFAPDGAGKTALDLCDMEIRKYLAKIATQRISKWLAALPILSADTFRVVAEYLPIELLADIEEVYAYPNVAKKSNPLDAFVLPRDITRSSRI